MLDKKAVIYVLAVVEAVIWGFSFVGTKAALESLSPIEVLVMRWTIGAIVLILLAVVGVVKVNFKGKKLGPVILVAIAQPCIYAICEVWGINLTTTSESAIMIALVPIFVLILSALFLKTKFDKISVFAVLLAFTGVIITTLFSPDFSAGGKIVGYLCLICAVISGAVFTIGTNKISDRFTPMEITMVMAIEGTVFFNMVSLIQGNGFTAYRITFTDSMVFWSVMFLALGCTVICYLIFNIVISKLPPHQASTLQVNLITLVGVLSGILLLNDSFGLYTVVGMLLILIGVVITNIKEENNEENINTDVNT